MTDIIKLQRKLRRFFGLNIEFNSAINNIQLNGIYVTHINEERYQRSNKMLKGLVEELNKESDYERNSAEVILEELIKMRNKIKEMLLDADYLFSPSAYELSEQPPIVNPIPPQAFMEPGLESENRKAMILDLLADFFNINFYSDAEEINSIICKEKTFRGQKVGETELDHVYAIGHLAYSLSLQVEVMTDFINYFSEVYIIVESDSPSSTISTFPGKFPEIEFNLKKIDIALFFEILYEEGIVKIEGRDEEDRFTRLKEYIDTANIFYMDDKVRTRVKKINKQFSMLRNQRIAYNEKNEKMLLENLINKFQNRLKSITEEPNIKKYS